MTYPAATDPVSALTRADGSTEAHSVDHGRVIEVWENVLSHGAKGDGTTNDTAAFDAAATAAGDGGVVYIPPGRVYRLADWTPPQNKTIHIKGGGTPNNNLNGGTVLKAYAGATYVVKMLGQFMGSIENLMIDGNSEASKGLLIDGSATQVCQENLVRGVWFVRCSLGVHLGASGPGGQVDKTTLQWCRFDEGAQGIYLEGNNTQHTLLLNTTIASADQAVRMKAGGLTWIGGGTGSCGNTVTFEGPTIEQVTFIDFISENLTGIDIDGRTHWPFLGVKLINSILAMETGSCVEMGTFGVLVAEQTAFSNDIVITSDGRFEDRHCRFEYGKGAATGLSPGIYNPATGAGCTRISVCPRTDYSTESLIRRYGGADGTTVLYQEALGSITITETLTADDVVVGTSGKLQFGDSSVFIQRASPTALFTFQSLYSEPAAGTDIAFGSLVQGESVAWWSVLVNGKMHWGPGGGVGSDTTLERSAANVLAMGSNDAFKTGSAATHAALPAATGYAAGAQFYCVEHKQPLWSDATSWYEADGTAH